MNYLMGWFDEVFYPGGHGNGPFPLEFHELESYSRVMKRALRDWEMLLLRDMSEAYCREYAFDQKRKSEQPPGMRSVNMKDPEAVKALFSKQGGSKKAKGKS